MHPLLFLGPTFSLICNCRTYLRPQFCKSWILEDLTDIVILGPTITLQYRENVGLRNKRHPRN